MSVQRFIKSIAKMVHTKLFLFIGILFVHVFGEVAHPNKFKGDTCLVNETMGGICQEAQKCPESLEMLKKTRRTHDLQKCEWDGLDEIVCCPGELVIPKVTMVSRTSVRISDIECGKYNAEIIPVIQDTIRNGVDAKDGEFPHMAAIGYTINQKIVYRCGGTLISDMFILTAAHCLNARDSSPTVVKLGSIYTYNETTGQVFDVETPPIIHENYKPPKRYNDIGLIKLKKAVQFTQYIYPVCLHTQGENLKHVPIATGWGNTILHWDEGSLILQRAELPVVNSSYCGDVYRLKDEQRQLPNGIISSQMCAGNSDKDTCKGDSGGPLQILLPTFNVWVVIGVTSFGTACGGSPTPGVYTRVSSYVDWIESKVWPLNTSANVANNKLIDDRIIFPDTF